MFHYCYSAMNFIDTCSHFLPLFEIFLICAFLSFWLLWAYFALFSNFLKWKFRLLIWALSTFVMQAFNVITFFLSTAFVASHVRWIPKDIVIIFAFNHHTYFKEIKERRIVCNIYPDIYYFCCFSFIPDVSSFLLVLFPCVWRTLFSISFKADLLTTDFSLSFSSSENIFISSSFVRDVLTGCRILGWQFFSFSTWKMFHFLASMISDEKSAVI